MIAFVLAIIIAMPTPSPTLSPLPAQQINYYAVQGARASGLDPQFVRAVIDAESAGDPHAVSRAGAVGLMQLMAGTASDCGIHDRYDALENVICGSRSLAGLVHRYGIATGIAAYNFGSGNIEAAGGDLKKTPTETQQYVRDVIARYDTLQHAGALVVEEPATPSPSPSPVSNPCAHRVFCGPIHILPRDSAGWQRAAAQVVASLVSSSAFRASQARASAIYPQLSFNAGHPVIDGAHADSFGLSGPTNARPFFSAFSSYVIGDVVEHATQSEFRMPAAQKKTFEQIDALGAIGDAFSYRSTFAAAHDLSTQAQQAQRAIDASQFANSKIVWLKGNGPVTLAGNNLLLGGTINAHGPVCFGFFSCPVIHPGASYSRLVFEAEAAYGLAEIPLRGLAHAGPIRLLPSDPDERRALLANFAAALADGIVTAHGTHGDPGLETDPFVRPFVRGGMQSLMTAWIFQIGLRQMLIHNAATRTSLDRYETSQHIFGFGSWLSPDSYGFGVIPTARRLEDPFFWHLLSHSLLKGNKKQ
jgi:hypothetical protein